MHPIYQDLPMQLLSTEDFDTYVMKDDQKLKGVFFWGHNCPNCEVAKRVMSEHLEEIKAAQIDWYHVNVYNDFDLGTRFGLHGIPVFIFFRNKKNLGRVTSFPGINAFLEVLRKLVSKVPTIISE